MNILKCFLLLILKMWTLTETKQIIDGIKVSIISNPISSSEKIKSMEDQKIDKAWETVHLLPIQSNSKKMWIVGISFLVLTLPIYNKFGIIWVFVLVWGIPICLYTFSIKSDKKKAEQIMGMGKVITTTITTIQEDRKDLDSDGRISYNNGFLTCKAITENGEIWTFIDYSHYARRETYSPQIWGTVEFFVNPSNYNEFVIRPDSYKPPKK